MLLIYCFVANAVICAGLNLHIPALDSLNQLGHILTYVNTMLPLEVPINPAAEPVVEIAKTATTFDFSNLPEIDLAKGLQTFVQKNPEWGGSTSAFIKNLVDGDFFYLKYLYDPFTDARDGVNELLKDSDIASTGTTEYLANSLQSFFKGGPGKTVEGLIQANPEFQQSTSQYLREGFKESFRGGRENSGVVDCKKSRTATVDFPMGDGILQ